MQGGFGMKDLRHHRSKFQKKVFREAKKYAMERKNHSMTENKRDRAIPNLELEDSENHKKKTVPIIRTHKKRFH